MTTPRYRRSSVRAVLETVARDHAAASAAHDALWAALWNRRYDDVDDPVWLPETAYAGLVAFFRTFPGGSSLTGIDTGEAFVTFKNIPEVPPIGSRVRVITNGRDQWKIADGAQTLGLGLDLRFDEHGPADPAWIEILRAGVVRLRDLLEDRREALSQKRAALGGLSEPPPLEDLWREEVEAIRDRVLMETEYTADEATSLTKARAKGPRFADVEEKRVLAARKERFQQRYNEEVIAFRDGRWLEIKEPAAEALKKYAEFKTEIVRLEDALHRGRLLTERAMKATHLLDAFERAAMSVRNVDFDPARLETEPRLGEELLRTIELLHGAIPQKSHATATSFSAYRAPTHGPSVTPPRL